MYERETVGAICQLSFVPVNVWGHVHVIVRYPSTVPPGTETATPRIMEPLSADPSPYRYWYFRPFTIPCHRSKKGENKKSPEEKPASADPGKHTSQPPTNSRPRARERPRTNGSNAWRAKGQKAPSQPADQSLHPVGLSSYMYFVSVPRTGAGAGTNYQCHIIKPSCVPGQ